MTDTEFINSLTIEEMRNVLWQFSRWFSYDGCPSREHKEYCDDEDECNYEPQGMCWIRFYVWQFRERQAERKAGGDKQ